MKISPAKGNPIRRQDGQVIAVAAPTPTHGRLATIAFLFITLFLMVFWAGKGFGQAAGKYDVEQLHPTLQKEEVMRQVESARRRLVSRTNADTSSSEWKKFRAYYTAYIFVKMTQPQSRGELSSIVENLLKDLERAQKAGATAAPHLVDWIADGATKVAAGNYHPAARINATILLGRLDEAPANNSAGTPPKPSTKAMNRLFALWNDQTAPDGVRAAALQGLRRAISHSFQSLSDNARAPLRTAMYQLADSAPPAGRSPAAHGFMQRYALDILYVLNDEANAQKLTDTLIQLSSDPDADPVISLYAAQKLARLGKELKPIADPAALAKAWSSKAGDIFEQQATYLTSMTPPKPAVNQPRLIDPAMLENQNRMNGAGYGSETMAGEGSYGSDMMYGSGGSGSGMSEYPGGEMSSDMGGYGEMMGGYGEMMGGPGSMYGGRGPLNPQPVEVIAVRRKLNHALQSLKLGLTGSASMEPPRNPAGVVQATAEENRAALQQLVDAIAATVETINDRQYATREDFAEMVAQEAEALKALSERLGGGAAPTAPPEETAAPPSPDVAFARPPAE